MFEALKKAYAFVWDTAGSVLSWLDKVSEKSTQAIFVFGAVLGVVGFNAIYFANAREVRLLYVVLLAIPGAGVGALLAGLLGGFVRFLVAASVVGVAVALSLVPVAVGLYLAYLAILLLHAIVVWRN